MEKRPVPYRKTVFVCTNVRTDGRVACANPGRGGDVVCKLLKEEVKKAGLKNHIRVARSGCLDICSRGPNLFIYPDGECYSGVQESDAPELLRKIQETSA